MSTASTITVQRSTPQRATITFTNPPVNLVVAETVVRLHEIVSDLTDDPDIQVVVFKSGLTDFFINHFDFAAAADLPAAEVILTSSDYAPTPRPQRHRALRPIRQRNRAMSKLRGNSGSALETADNDSRLPLPRLATGRVASVSHAAEVRFARR